VTPEISELLAVGVPVFACYQDPSSSTGYALPPGWQHTPIGDPGAADGYGAVMGHTLDLVDVDPRNGGDLSLQQLQAAGMMPTVYAQAATPSGGMHYFVAAMGVGSRDNVLPGIDVKGGMADGSSRGFAFIAPTVRVSKITGEPGAYAWVLAPDAERIAAEVAADDSGLALAEVVSALRAPRQSAANVRQDYYADDPFSGPVTTMTWEQASANMRAAVEAFSALDPDTGEGFNEKLNIAAMTLGHYVPHMASVERATAALVQAAERNGSLTRKGSTNYKPMGLAAVLKTIDSGLRAGMREPNTVAARAEPAEESDASDTPSIDPVDALLGEFLSAETIRTIPNPRPLIQGVLDLDTISWLIGKSGSYKSFVALDMAACVATGRHWHGHAVTPGVTVYIVAEGARGMKLRVAAWERLYGEIPGNLWFLPRPVQAKQSEAWQTLVLACRRLAAEFVIIDTQARVTLGLDENSNTEMGLFVDRADDIRRATGACVMPVHHIGRQGTDARGASALDGAQDTELRVERHEDRRITVHMDKQKDADDTAEVELELAVVDRGRDPETDRDLSSLAVVDAGTLPAPVKVRDWIDNLPVNQAEIIGIISDHFPTGGTESNIERVLNERRAEREMPKMAHGSFTTARGALAKKEIIVKIKKTQKYILASMDAIDD
jgi:hypothetical protein